MKKVGKTYGEIKITTDETLTTKEKLEFIKESVGELINEVIETGLEPNFGTMAVIVKEMTAISGPFCVDENGEPCKWMMSAGIRFEVKEKEDGQE